MDKEKYVGLEAPDRRRWYEKLWRRLGFRMAHVERDYEERNDGFTPGGMVSGFVIELSWKDRLRILISGKAHVESFTKTDVIVSKVQSRAAFAVLPPIFRMPRGNKS